MCCLCCVLFVAVCFSARAVRRVANKVTLNPKKYH